MDFKQIIADQNARCEPFARAKAIAAGDIKYDAILSAKKEALASNKAALSAVSDVLLTAQKKNVSPRNAVSMIFALSKSQKAAQKALKLSGAEYYIMTPSIFHENNERAIEALNRSTECMRSICDTFEASFKLDEDSTNSGIAAYINAKNMGLSDYAAHNAACDVKFKSSNCIVRWLNRIIIQKSYWKNKMKV